MIEVPNIVQTFVDDASGVTYYRVKYQDGHLEDMTQQQYEYLKSSADAVAELDANAAEDTQQPAEEPAQNITESPDLRDG